MECCKAADRSDLCCVFPCSPEMKKCLTSGTTLVVDRYAFSGVAYTAAKQVTIPCFSYAIINSEHVYVN